MRIPDLVNVYAIISCSLSTRTDELYHKNTESIRML